jgi:hypothetical protein
MADRQTCETMTFDQLCKWEYQKKILPPQNINKFLDCSKIKTYIKTYNCIKRLLYIGFIYQLSQAVDFSHCLPPWWNPIRREVETKQTVNITTSISIFMPLPQNWPNLTASKKIKGWVMSVLITKYHLTNKESKNLPLPWKKILGSCSQ